MNLNAFIESRPFCYHLTARGNAELIRRSGVLESAAEIFRRAGLGAERTQRRRGPRSVRVNGDTFTIRDQDPLHPGHIDFDPGWGIGGVCQLLNSFVFFWPGTVTGPIKAGQNHFKRYQDETPAILRVPTRELIEANAQAVRFSRCNSGSPRSNPSCGKGRRGATTFLPPGQFAGTPGEVIELVVEGRAVLPPQVEWLR